MLIDWFTIVAQLINFVILLVALKYLLFDRIVEAMERRRQSIRELERGARAREADAADRAEKLDEERSDLDRRRHEIIEQAEEDAERRRRALLEEARQEVEAREREWWESVRSRQDRLSAELEDTSATQAIAIARQAFRDLADSDLEAEMVRAFFARLSRLSDEERAVFVEALRAPDGPVLVRTGFELSDGARDRIRAGLRDLMHDKEREIEWERDPDLVAGLVVDAGPKTIGWTIDSYLEQLRRSFTQVFDREVGDVEADSSDEGSPRESTGDHRSTAAGGAAFS